MLIMVNKLNMGLCSIYKYRKKFVEKAEERLTFVICYVILYLFIIK